MQKLLATLIAIVAASATALADPADCNQPDDRELQIAACTQRIESDPLDGAAYYNRGNAHIARKDYDRAIADYSKAIEIDPKGPDAYYNRGRAYGDKGDDEYSN